MAISAIQFLSKETEKVHWLKAAMDPIRGALSTLFLFPYINTTAYGAPAFDYPSFMRLIEWLNAVGGYDEEVRYFSEWGRFIRSKECHDAEECLRKAVFIGQWFEIHSRKALSLFSPKTDAGNSYNDGDTDADLFKSRKETEYFRKLVAVEA